MHFTWNLGKNSKLKEERGISFEDVVRCIIAGNFKVRENWSTNHPGQEIFVIKTKGKEWTVPFRRTKHGFHLHTIFPKD